MHGGFKPTLSDVAQRAHVSTATVSRCLNLPDQVRAETRARVEAAVAELGYTPHFGARILATNRTNTIGAVLPTMENAIFARGVQVLEDELSARGVTLLVATSHYDMARERDQVRTLLGRGVDGLILVGEARPPEVYDHLVSRGVPFVLVWTHSGDSPHPCVGFDNRGAARAMAEHVLALGHREIAMISGLTLWNDRASQRIEGVREVLAAHGLGLEPSRLLEAAYSIEAGAEAAIRLAGVSPRPTAILCGNDVQAAGALIGLRSLGLSVPDEISVVGFDDIDLAIAVTPALTTVHVPHRRMGAAAADLLHKMICGEPPGDGVVFETMIVERASMARIANNA
jgi:LacI family transcriptional regulator